MRLKTQWLGRALLAVLVPSVLILAAELSLIAVGYGIPAAYFLTRETGQGPRICTNPGFTHRFLPPGMERLPLPLAIPVEKSPGELRVVILGSSAALGDPDPAYSFGRQLEVMLAARYPGHRITLINTGLTAVNSHVVREIAGDLATLKPDLVVVYTGNNEVVGPYGPGSALAGYEPSLWIIRARGWVLGTRVGQALRSLLASAGTASGPTSWGGMKMFLDHEISADDPSLDRVRANFRSNLEEIVQRSKAAGASAVIVCTLPANLRDCAPFASRPSSALTGDRLGSWRGLVAAGDSAVARSETDVALSSWRDALAIDAGDAALHYRLGRLLLAIGRESEAATHLTEALERDTLRFRADLVLNAVAGEVAAHTGALLADLRAAVAFRDPAGLPGTDLFFDHVHLSFLGNTVAARAVMDAASPALAALGWTPSGPALTDTDCARALAYTSWDEARLIDDMMARKKEPPFTNQVDHVHDLEMMASRRKGLRAEPDSTTIPAWLSMYDSALTVRPDDPYILERNAAFLVHMNQQRLAVPLLRRVVEAWPDYELAPVNLAIALTQSGRPDEGEAVLRSLLAEHPGALEARIALAQLLASTNQQAAAATEWRYLVDRRIEKPTPYNALAWILATTRDPDLRDGIEAVRLAEIAMQRSGGTDLAISATLAAAYAASGQYAKAAQLQAQVIDRVERSGIDAPLADLKQNLEIYRSGKGLGAE